MTALSSNSVYAARGVFPAESGAYPNVCGISQTCRALCEIAYG